MLQCGFPNYVIQWKPPCPGGYYELPYELIPGEFFGYHEQEYIDLRLRQLKQEVIYRYLEAKAYHKYDPDRTVIAVPVPCHQCVACRLNQARKKADQVMLEAQYYDESELWFATITYDDDHIYMAKRYRAPVLSPQAELVTYFAGTDEEIETYGEMHEVLQDEQLVDIGGINYEHVKLFHKVLRKHIGPFRFFACSEYGSLNLRPHYHVIYMGLHLNDVRYYGRSKMGSILYKSRYMEGAWGRGFVTLGAVTKESVAYTARYAVKKVTGKAREKEILDFYRLMEEDPVYVKDDRGAGRPRLLPHDLMVAQEKTYSSNRPGLGYRFYADHPEYDPSKPVFTLKGSDGKDIVYSVPYFERLFAKEHEAAMIYVKDQRCKDMVDRSILRKQKTDYSEEDLLRNAREKARVIKSKLIRPI